MRTLAPAHRERELRMQGLKKSALTICPVSRVFSLSHRQKDGVRASTMRNRRVKKAAGPVPPALRALFPEVFRPRQRAFLVAFLHARTRPGAARISGVPLDTHKSWLRRDPFYREHYARAKKIVADAAPER